MITATHELSSAESARLEAQRKWVREHYEPRSQRRFDTVQGKVTLIGTILDNGWVEAHETLKLQCLGVAFGDALAQELGLSWIAVENEYGRDPALAMQGSSLKIFPLAMIAQRIEQGERVNAVDLFADTCKAVLEFAQMRD